MSSCHDPRATNFKYAAIAAACAIALTGGGGSNNALEGGPGDGDAYIEIITPWNCTDDEYQKFTEEFATEGDEIPDDRMDDFKDLILKLANAQEAAAAHLLAKEWPDAIKDDIADVASDNTVFAALARARVAADGPNPEEFADWNQVTAFQTYYFENSKAPDTARIRAELGLPEQGGYDCEGFEVVALEVPATEGGTGDVATYEKLFEGAAAAATKRDDFLASATGGTLELKDMSEEDRKKYNELSIDTANETDKVARELLAKEWPAQVQNAIRDKAAELYIAAAFERAQALTDTASGDLSDRLKLQDLKLAWPGLTQNHAKVLADWRGVQTVEHHGDRPHQRTCELLIN